ncbi:MAG: lysine--tRNA ligase [candidate division Zixibacteria bacterium]|nr:lysine--tRNA ligase [candidate division Zixibacteria bacterium]
MSDEKHINQNQSGDRTETQKPLAELVRTRRNKVLKFEKEGINPYPYKYERTHSALELQENFEKLVESATEVSIAGRIMLKRKMGKSIFADVHDQSGKIQVYLKTNDVGAENFERFDILDLGDIVGCRGTMFTTRTGEKTIKVASYEILCKSLHPLPDKHSGLTDVETRYRRRYADLIVSPEVREVFRKRTEIIRTIRDFLNSKGFLEVETPILQPLYGGGAAKPFKTYHEKLGKEMFLRIADELYLKRLIVGGFDKVWEFCKDFRNEGLSRLHNPEFSMIEMYWAYADYKDIAALFEDLLRDVVFKIHASYKIKYGDHQLDFEPKFKWITMIGSINDAIGVDLTDMSFEEVKKAAKEHGVAGEGLINRGKVIEALWEEKVEHTLIQPTFVADFPVEISPLAKKHRDDPRLTERFELFIAGQETGNAFSELNDPVDQLQRFIEQRKALEAGDEEAQPLDDDFVTALAYGMPPTAGLGFGIDRLVMILTNQQTIRDVILFPQMKDAGDGSGQFSKILAKIATEENS